MSSPPEKNGQEGSAHEARALAKVQKALAKAQEEAAALTSSLTRARRRLLQRIAAVERDLERIEEAQAWATRASWLVAAAARAPRGARSLQVSDWSSGEEQVFSFPLEPSRPAREQVEAAFQRARRLRRGKPLAEERLRAAKDAVAAVDGLVAEVAALAPPSEEALEELRQRAVAALPHDVQRGLARPAFIPGRRKKEEGKKPPFRSFTARSGMRILVGRRAELNDELTFQVSRPHHLWLHAKDQPGAHVIAWNEKGKSLTEGELVDAACLAAHFSDARGEPVVDVTYTPRRYVRKPRKAPPGLVLADRAKVIAVRIDPAHLKTLLETEVDEG
ncbi:NFACT RNA binding domain-containing protein [Pendulispora brunnea]|uniref:NFACT RNA binding domain-containing protein n=1 Tax=Pendulispora brunnea TaxID=2905690 RepID=A0ABZ2JWS6_9BACT